ncbi:hypothetical protein [Nocardia sp. NPDC003963]
MNASLSLPEESSPQSSIRNWFVMTLLMPLAYGYLRDDLIGDLDAGIAENVLRTAAGMLGYELGTVFHEPPCRSGVLPPVFVDLVQECRRAASHMVLTLPGHISVSDSSVCSRILRAALNARAEAIVHEVRH